VLHSFERAAQLFAAGVVDPDVFISHRYPLDRYAEAMTQFRAGVGRKIQIAREV
ncbi:MAG: alcohol dehydrogenase, partial [Stackebrandtia sp.]